MDLVYDNAGVSAWVQKHIPDCYPFERATAIGFAQDGELIAGVVYTNWNPRSGVIEMSAAATSPRWIAPASIKAMFGYPFDQLDCQLVVLRVSERNQRMISIAERFGFVGHLIPRLRGPDEAEWIFTLTAEKWRSTRYGRIVHEH